jgi:acetyl esterase/lipase
MKIWKKSHVLVALGLLLTACSGPQILDLIVPSTGYIKTKNISYGEEERQQLDIYIPEEHSSPSPVIVFFYGGSWKQGSKEDYRFIGQAFASRGYVTVIADYRLYPKNYFPTFMEDGAKAVAWVHEHIHRYHGDAKNIFLAGHSAGAYNAVMLSLNEEYLNAENGTSDWIRGTIGIAGPYDFLPMTDPDVIAVFSKVQEAATQPVNYVRENAPPMLLLVGDADEDVLPRNSFNLSNRLKEKGNEVKVVIYPDVAHIGIILSIAKGFRYKADTLNDIHAFIQQYVVR